MSTAYEEIKSLVYEIFYKQKIRAGHVLTFSELIIRISSRLTFENIDYLARVKHDMSAQGWVKLTPQGMVLTESGYRAVKDYMETHRQVA